MKLNKLFIFFFTLIAVNAIKGQACATVSYTYDACGNRIKRTLQVNPCNFNQTFRPNPDSSANDSLTKEEMVFTKEIKVYPNPTAESVFIEWQNDSLCSLENICLTDITGKQLKEMKPTENDLQSMLDLSDQKNGIYTLELRFTNKKRKYYKVIKN